MSNKLIENVMYNEHEKIDRGKRVKFLRVHIAAMTGEEFAKCCGGVARGTITNWETGKGKSGLKEKGAKLITQSMQNIGIDCSMAWLLQGSGEPPKITDQNKLTRLHYPISSHTPRGYIGESAFHEEKDYVEEITLFKKQYPSYLLHTVEDDSMWPMYYPGDCIAGPTLPLHQMSHLKDNIYIIRFDATPLLVRQVRFETTPNQVMSCYVMEMHKVIDHPPIIRVPTTAIRDLAPVTRLWRHYNLPSMN